MRFRIIVSEHPDTVWYNITSRLGMKAYFRKNSGQILDFFTSLTIKRINEGKRILLIAKKCSLPLCARGMEKRLYQRNVAHVRIVSNGWILTSLKNCNIIPIIHYGMIGTNLFQHFDCAYCLTGYYVTENVVNGILQDVLASDMHIPIKVYTQGSPRRRKAGVLNNQHRCYDVHHLAQLALNQQEMDVVLQAVGRVRPYTKGREIITFQCAEHPNLTYTREFTNIEETRLFFQINSFRERKKRKQSAVFYQQKRMV